MQIDDLYHGSQQVCAETDAGVAGSEAEAVEGRVCVWSDGVCSIQHNNWHGSCL